MAIAFSTGTINQPDAGSVGLALIEQLRDDIVSHTAWDLVEEFTPASGQVRWYVFKCLASVSGLAADFFVVIGRTLGNGEFRMFICEGYNSSTHVASKYCVANSASGAVLYDALGRIPDATTYTLSTAVLPGSTGTPNYNSWAPSGTSSKWWLIVADDGFTMAFNGASNGYFHCGAYIPVTVLPMLLPIHCLGSSSFAGHGHMTRNPALAGISHFGCGLQNVSSASTTDGPVLGFTGNLQLNDALQAGQRLVAEQAFTMFQAFGASAVQGYSQMGWAVGKVKRMRVNYTTAPVGFAFGDGYVLNGRLWVPYHPTDGRFWDTGVAA